MRSYPINLSSAILLLVSLGIPSQLRAEEPGEKAGLSIATLTVKKGMYIAHAAEIILRDGTKKKVFELFEVAEDFEVTPEDRAKEDDALILWAFDQIGELRKSDPIKGTAKFASTGSTKSDTGFRRKFGPIYVIDGAFDPDQGVYIVPEDGAPRYNISKSFNFTYRRALSGLPEAAQASEARSGEVQSGKPTKIVALLGIETQPGVTSAGMRRDELNVGNLLYTYCYGKSESTVLRVDRQVKDAQPKDYLRKIRELKTDENTIIFAYVSSHGGYKGDEHYLFTHVEGDKSTGVKRSDIIAELKKKKCYSIFFLADACNVEIKQDVAQAFMTPNTRLFQLLSKLPRGSFLDVKSSKKDEYSFGLEAVGGLATTALNDALRSVSPTKDDMGVLLKYCQACATAKFQLFAALSRERYEQEDQTLDVKKNLKVKAGQFIAHKAILVDIEDGGRRTIWELRKVDVDAEVEFRMADDEGFVGPSKTPASDLAMLKWCSEEIGKFRKGLSDFENGGFREVAKFHPPKTIPGEFHNKTYHAIYVIDTKTDSDGKLVIASHARVELAKPKTIFFAEGRTGLPDNN